MTTLKQGRIHLTCPACSTKLTTTKDHRITITPDGPSAQPRIACPECSLAIELRRGELILHGRKQVFPFEARTIISAHREPEPSALTITAPTPRQRKPEPHTPAPTPQAAPTYEDYTFRELQEACKDKGLPANGKKTDLITRLLEAQE